MMGAAVLVADDMRICDEVCTQQQERILAGLVFSAFRTAEEEPRLLEMMPILLTFKAD